MIPAFGPSGVLPPFVGSSPADRAHTSPYETTATELVNRFATSPERALILRGLLDYRESLVAAGIIDGFQWLDGSFVEDCETVHGRPPRDIDVVTFAYRPPNIVNDADWRAFFYLNVNLFDPSQVKISFHCDAYYIDLGKRAHIIVMDTAYFNGLFSHQRDTAQWKGMLRVPIVSDDAAARFLI